jgi:hypothetical protein
MNDKKLFLVDGASDNLLSNLDSRDIALWLADLPRERPQLETLISFLGLPWRLILSEVSDNQLITELEQRSRSNDDMTRRRGFVQIVDSDPSRIAFPQRCLPIYLLNGREGSSSSEFEDKLRRMTMVEDLRRSGVRQLLVLSGDDYPIPLDLSGLWDSGFRTQLTVASELENADTVLQQWLERSSGFATASLSRAPPNRFIESVLNRYVERFAEQRKIARVRDQFGNLHHYDLTEIDEPERPILEQFLILEDRDLTPLSAEELSESDFNSFFRDPTTSWRPYAAGLPWMRDDQTRRKFENCLSRLNSAGPQENCIAYIATEDGAGGTTLARTLAWEFGREGYPILVAKPFPFLPDALAVGNFLTRARHLIENQIEVSSSETTPAEGGKQNGKPNARRYETPWILVFDRMHWEYRDAELRRFRNELEKQGRPVCILVVTGPVRELAYFDTSTFKSISTLNHTLDQEEARDLGRHLNKFLRVYGKPRPESQWDKFYQEHTVRYLEGVAAFWVTLSFWLQWQYDLSESIQEWIYRAFISKTSDGTIREALLEIAVMSSEHLPLPAGLLPPSPGQWPTSHVLEDRKSELAVLGLLSVRVDGEKHWALAHDILGRLLVNALFFDFATRSQMGFAEAKDAEHLRFLLLRKISLKRELGERSFQPLGEDFATAIFKIDPDHGRTSFTYIWREVLGALDGMPRSLRDTSRVFRHHSAISRRRIAMLPSDFYGVSLEDKVDLLSRAIDDINFALTSIEYTPGSEPDLNLYNSLANAYLDLANVEAVRGSSRDRIIELRRLANETTRRAYDESPTNSYIIETYVKNLLGNARATPEIASENCVEALGILFSAIHSNEGNYRRPQLTELADQALELLLKQSPGDTRAAEPKSTLDILILAWLTLSDGVDYHSGIALSEIPEQNRNRALDVLDHPLARGNVQALRLCYDLTCISKPYAFRQQIEFVQQLEATDYRSTPQLRLEYAILLFQTGRAAEGERAFRNLRKVWRETEHFVHVPDRLRWLREVDTARLKVVQVTTGSDYGHRAIARVQEFNNSQAPFRLEEFGFRELRPGVRFAAKVSFGHNGPFLRPVTAGPIDAS